MKTVKLNDQQISALETIPTNGVTRFVFPPFGVTFGFPDKE